MEPYGSLFLRKILFRKKKITIKKKLIYHHKIELVILISAKEEMSVNQS